MKVKLQPHYYSLAVLIILAALAASLTGCGGGGGGGGGDGGGQPGPTAGNVTGAVQNNQGQAITNFTANLTGGGALTINGNSFTFTGVAVGQQTLTVNAPTFNTSQSAVTVTAGQTTNVGAITLSQSDLPPPPPFQRVNRP